VCIVRQAAYYELALRREAQALRDAGLTVDVVCLREPDGPRREVVDGVTLHRLPLRRRRGGAVSYLFDYAGFFVAATVTVARLHLRHPYRVVQANSMPDALAFTALVPRLTGAKVIAFMKEPTPELGETKYGSVRLRRVLEVVEQAAVRFADLAFTVTDDLKEALVARGADAEKIHVVLNGPDSRHLLAHRTGAGPDPEHFTAVCHGLVDERYGHDTMVRAATLARQHIPGLRLRITGTGDYEPELRELIRAEGAEDYVHFLGWLSLPEVVAELERADVGIVAQKSSPYSNLVHTNKMFEFMLFDLPVVAGRLRSTERYFGDDAVQYFDAGSPESLADALVALHRDRERRHALVTRAHELCERYSWSAQKEIYLAAYAQLLGGLPEPTGARSGAGHEPHREPVAAAR
jgi:glycosyltransferase involved in cell wall biosynthesis